MATITSAVVGTVISPASWSSTSSWIGGVLPADGDTVIIQATSAIDPDVDMSAWTTGLVGLQIDGALVTMLGVSADRYVMMGGNVTGSGRWVIRLSSSPSYTFTIDFNGGNFGIRSSTLTLDFRSNEPTNRYCLLDDPAGEPINETVLAVDTDVSSDWSVGDTIVIANVNKAVDTEERTISAISSTTLTLNSGLTAGKLVGSAIALCTRNIRIIGSTHNALYDIRNGSFVRCEIKMSGGTGTAGINRSRELQFDGVLYGQCRDYTDFSDSGFVMSGVICGLYASSYGLRRADESNIHNALFLGIFNVISGNFGVSMSSSKCFGCNNVVVGSCGGYVQAEVNGCHTIFSRTKNNRINITGNNINIMFYDRANWNEGKVNVTNLTTLSSISTGNNLIESSFDGATIWNMSFKEHYHGRYNSDSFYHSNYVHGFSYGGSFVFDVTTPLATDFDQHFRHTCVDDDYWCFRQEEVIIQPSETLSVTGYMRAALDASQKIEIIDKFADPLVDSTSTALDTDTPTHSTSWVAISVSYENTGLTPKSVYIRTSAKHATTTMDEVWTIASAGGGTTLDPFTSHIIRKIG